MPAAFGNEVFSQAVKEDASFVGRRDRILACERKTAGHNFVG
jgi:hypothetical protein